MSADPHHITIAQVRELLTGLGIEPDTANIRTVVIESGKVTVVRYRLDESGHRYVVGPNELATETIMIKVVG